jgi:hypothetical protein
MIPGGRIPGKFSRPQCEWASALRCIVLVTQTSGVFCRGGGGDR